MNDSQTKFMTDFALSLFNSIVSSFVWVYVLIFFFRPRVVISKNISKVFKKGKYTYQIKVINRGRRDLFDLKMEAFIMTPRKIEGSTIFTRKKLITIPEENSRLSRYKPKDEGASHAFRFTIDEELDQIWTNNENKFLTLRFYSTDGFSGMRNFQEIEFHDKKLAIIEGDFKTGSSLDIN